MPSQNLTNLSQILAQAKFNGVAVKALLLATVLPTEAELDAWKFRSEVTLEHAVAGAYILGGFDCTLTIGATDITNNLTPVTIIPTVGNGGVVFANSTISSVGAMVYISTGTDTTDELLTFVDFGGTITSSSGDFKVTFSDPINISV